MCGGGGEGEEEINRGQNPQELYTCKFNAVSITASLNYVPDQDITGTKTRQFKDFPMHIIAVEDFEFGGRPQSLVAIQRACSSPLGLIYKIENWKSAGDGIEIKIIRVDGHINLHLFGSFTNIFLWEGTS